MKNLLKVPLARSKGPEEGLVPEIADKLTMAQHKSTLKISSLRNGVYHDSQIRHLQITVRRIFRAG